MQRVCICVRGGSNGMSPRLINALIDRFVAAGSDRVVYPVSSGGAQRNPVIWPRRCFAGLMALNSDQGGKSLLALETAPIETLHFEDQSVFRDIDTPDDLAVVANDLSASNSVRTQ